MKVEGVWVFDLAMAILIGSALLICNNAKGAGYEDVEIINVYTTTQVSCLTPRSGFKNQASQAAYLPYYGGSGIAETPSNELISGAGAGAIGGRLLAGASNPVAATLFGAIRGVATNYSAEELSASPTVGCTQVPKYVAVYRRSNGMTGQLTFDSWPTAKIMRIKFCPGPQGQLERPC